MLTDHSVDPKNGKPPEYLVIFFHGYGSNGALMAEHVGGLLGPFLPEAKIRCPDGPIEFYKMPDGKSGCSWFELRDLFDGDNLPEDRREIARRATTAAKEMNDYIDRVVAEEGLPEDRVIIAGFSQGGTMAFYTGLLRDSKVAGVYALSGGALDLLENPASRPPVGLVAGEREQQDYSGAPHALKVRDALDKAGFNVDCVIIPDQGHNISWKSMELLSVFTRAVTSDGFKTKAAAEQNNLPPKKIRRSSGPRP
jgi:phospholipase/carboxylesterase